MRHEWLDLIGCQCIRIRRDDATHGWHRAAASRTAHFPMFPDVRRGLEIEQSEVARRTMQTCHATTNRSAIRTDSADTAESNKHEKTRTGPQHMQTVGEFARFVPIVTRRVTCRVMISRIGLSLHHIQRTIALGGIGNAVIPWATPDGWTRPTFTIEGISTSKDSRSCHESWRK